MEFKVTLRGQEKLIMALKGAAARAADAKPFLTAYGEEMKGIVRESLDTETDPSNGAKWPALARISALSRRNGASNMLKGNTSMLADSLLKTAPVVDDTSVTISSDRPQARILQFGGTITPRNAKHMAIPLSVEASRAGARRWKKQNHGFWLRTKSGKLFLVRKDGKALEFGFMLVDKVVIPPRPYLGFRKKHRDKFLNMAIEWLDLGGD
jgi:phage gpG-like protein